MGTELDEVYIASIKEMFKEFDDEIIWSAIFDHGYSEGNEYRLENVVNYLLELSQDNKLDTSTETKKIVIPEKNFIESQLDYIEKEFEKIDENKSKKYKIHDENMDSLEIEPNLGNNSILSNLFGNKEGYQKLEN
jgi:hypothetical protein